MSGIVQQQVPEGYQRTEVGVIPESWRLIKLDNIAELTSSKRIFEDDYVQDGIPFYRGQEISQLLSGEPLTVKCYISKEKYKVLKNSFGAPKRGDVLITAVGTLGNAYLVDSDSPFYFKDGNLIWLRGVKDLILGRYLIKQMEWLKPKILEGAIGSSQKALTIVVLKKLDIPTPCIEEQTAIANALSDVDALITSLEKLIAKKRAIKTAGMQQLLTGKKRLPPFDTLATKNGTPAYRQTELGETPVDWEVSKIGEVAEFVGGSQPPKSTFKSAEKIGHIRLIQIRDYKKDTYATYIPEVLAQKKCNASDIMIGRYGPPIFQILRGIKGAYNVALIKAIPNSKVFKEFLYYTLKTEALFQIMEVLSQRSSGQTGVDLPALKAYPLALPTIEEQKSIVSALNDMDTEIDTLNKRLTKTQQLKQGMMQELLTGRTRLL